MMRCHGIDLGPDRWRKKYGGLMPSEMKRLKLLEEGHAAEEAGGGSLARQGDAAGCRQKKAMKPARARELVEYFRTSYRISIRRACGALRFDRSTYHYRHRRPEQASLRKRIRELSEACVR